MIKAIIFDCFGVLYPDTYWSMARMYLGEDLRGKKSELHDLVAQVDFGVITRDQLWQNFAKLVGKNTDDIYAQLKEMGGLDKRLLEFIESKKPDYKIGMISNVGQGFIERMFTDKPPEYYFDSLVLSSDVGLVKPDPEIYKLSAEQLGVEPEEAVFIDDIEKNSKGAEMIGMKSIHFKSYEQFIKEIEYILSGDLNK